MKIEATGNGAWTLARWRQLDQLVMLLREVSAINHGSHCLERIQRCIDLADGLQRTDWDSPDSPTSLTFFLAEQARENRAAVDLPESKE